MKNIQCGQWKEILESRKHIISEIVLKKGRNPITSNHSIKWPTCVQFQRLYMRTERYQVVDMRAIPKVVHVNRTLSSGPHVRIPEECTFSHGGLCTVLQLLAAGFLNHQQYNFDNLTQERTYERMLAYAPPSQDAIVTTRIMIFLVFQGILK